MTYGEYICPTCGKHWTRDDCRWEQEFPSMKPKLDSEGKQAGFVLCCGKAIILGYRKTLPEYHPIDWNKEPYNKSFNEISSSRNQSI